MTATKDSSNDKSEPNTHSSSLDIHLRRLTSRRILITGGASFIGSHLAELLLQIGSRVRIIDDFSSGKDENISKIKSDIELLNGTVADSAMLDRAVNGCDTVFHLAAIHGGRGFIDSFPERMLENLSLDWKVFDAAVRNGARRVVHASSACAYPISLQESAESRLLLSEEMAGFDAPSQSFPDGAYGWSKLMGEYQLMTFSQRSADFTGRSARIFTAYGSRENESHAMVALWAKAALRLDPYPIWGDGTQTRNFTHVKDTVIGLALLASDETNASFDVFNVGSSTHHTIRQAVQTIFDIDGWSPNELKFEEDKPVGVKSRAASNEKLMRVFGWMPTTSLETGIRELGNWWNSHRLPNLDVSELADRLISR